MAKARVQPFRTETLSESGRVAAAAAAAVGSETDSEHKRSPDCDAFGGGTGKDAGRRASSTPSDINKNIQKSPSTKNLARDESDTGGALSGDSAAFRRVYVRIKILEMEDDQKDSSFKVKFYYGRLPARPWRPAGRSLRPSVA